jgi:hypothetical protein
VTGIAARCSSGSAGRVSGGSGGRLSKPRAGGGMRVGRGVGGHD